MSLRSSWSSEEYANACKWWRDGLSASEIAARLPNRSRSSIVGLVNRNRDDFPPRPKSAKSQKSQPQRKPPTAWTQEELGEAARLWNDENYSAINVAASIGRSVSAVRVKIKEHPHLFKKRKPRTFENFKLASKIPPAYAAPTVKVPDERRVVPFVEAIVGGLCAFPADLGAHDADANMPVCGCPREKGQSYCQYHADVSRARGSVFVPGVGKI
ncbi:MAG: GcrA family cell cycle regulator [Pseudomonadota bacterium]